MKEKEFSRHVITTAILCMVDGIVIASLHQETGQDEMTEIASSTVKLLIAGHGRTGKEKVADV